MNKASNNPHFLKERTEQIVRELYKALSVCTDAQYSMPLPILSGSSLGEHTRHITEFFQCLLEGVSKETIAYDQRKRDRVLENDKQRALQTLTDTCIRLPAGEKQMILTENMGNGMALTISTGYYREWLYAIEHAIHHMAIIKIGLRSLNLSVEQHFGVAPSTLQHRDACAS
ncbi:MAG: hypothetical protein MUE99_04220 [Chitinophagaceae bacterium]|nr:hypothetical protein [Chitinophagaceae bacterium]